jgi:hypothetical protein
MLFDKNVQMISEIKRSTEIYLKLFDLTWKIGFELAISLNILFENTITNTSRLQSTNNSNNTRINNESEASDLFF